MKKLILSLIAALTSACASTPAGQIAQDIGLQYVVGKAIEQSKDPAALAARIVKAANDAKTFIDFNELSPTELQVVLLERLDKSDLGPADKLLLSGLVTAGVAELQRRIEVGQIPAEVTLTANRLLSLVATAASVYVRDGA